MRENPYRIEGPALLSFSGGETSRKMIEEIIAAHDGRLPDDLWIAFSNTGKEAAETLDFIDACERLWQHRVWWIEYQVEAPGFRIVDYKSAARNGEPFEALIMKKSYVPNRGAPYCSIELKARTLRNFVKATYGLKRWKSVLGLRRDEELRVMGAIGRNHSGKDPWRNAMPMYDACHVKADVQRHSEGHPVQLGIPGYKGNCVFCWKKSLPKRVQLIREAIASGDTADLMWWSEMEQRTGSTFHPELSVLDLIARAEGEPMLPLDDDPDDDDGECGFTCLVADADQMEMAA